MKGLLERVGLVERDKIRFDFVKCVDAMAMTYHCLTSFFMEY